MISLYLTLEKVAQQEVQFIVSVSFLMSQVGLMLMLVTLIVFAVLVGILLGEAILTVGAPRLVATAALLPLIGYGLGYVLSLFFFRFDGP